MELVLAYAISILLDLYVVVEKLVIPCPAHTLGP
jgi:hypothetical protein